MKKVIVILPTVIVIMLAGCKISGEYNISSHTSEEHSLQGKLMNGRR